MSTVNIYSQSSTARRGLVKSVDHICGKVAELLSGESRRLTHDEISVRLIDSDVLGMLAPIEEEISAQNYPERALNADRICLDMRAYMQQLLPETGDARVWLLLVELGHSWTEEEIASLHAGNIT